MPQQQDRDLNPHDRRRVAVAAFADDRTVARYLRGEPVRPSLAARIRDALRRLGLDGTHPPRPRGGAC